MTYIINNNSLIDKVIIVNADESLLKKFKRHIILTKKEHQQYNFTELTKSGFMQKIN